MRTQPKLNRHRSAGFGLVEIMVAVLIGMFGVLIMLQVLSVSEEQKRTTVGGNDAMNEGVLALYALQQDLRMAGYGISDAKILGCAITLRTGVDLAALAPVIINPLKADGVTKLITDADANTDTLLIFSTNTYSATKGDTVTAASNKMQAVTTFSQGDYVVHAVDTQSAGCALTLDSVASVDTSTITLTSSLAYSSGTIFDFGQSYHAIGYAVRNGNLTTCDFGDSTTDCSSSGNWRSISSNIVSLRAQYGQDTTAGTMDGVVDVYNQTTPATTIPACGWARTPGIRFVVVSRSSDPLDTRTDAATGIQKDTSNVSTITWDGQSTDNPTGSTATAIDLTGITNYQNYRYRAFQVAVPLRNISWLGQVTGC